jgi:triacylglycerol lipase
VPFTDAGNICSGCEVHSGFYDTWQTVASDITATLDSALSTYPGYTVVATGHSLGGALAAIGATVLRSSGQVVQLVRVILYFSQTEWHY